MFNIGYLNNSGSFKPQCQKSAKAHGLELSRIQSIISTESIIAEQGAGQSTAGTKSRVSTAEAEWINIRPRNEVRQDRFSMSFSPEQIKYAQGFFTVKAFIPKLYNGKYIGAREIAKAIYFTYDIRTYHA
jgi:hypothetical protein